MIRRHDLVRVAQADWDAALDGVPGLERLPGPARTALRGWTRHGRPAVIRRRGGGEDPARLPLGVPLPPGLGGFRIALSLPPGSAWVPVVGPGLAEAAAGAPPALAELAAALDALGAEAGVAPRPFGSLLWGAVTGLRYLRDGSDLDVLWPVTAETDLPFLLASLRRIADASSVGVDGEVVLPDGVGLQWRELDRARSAPGGEVLAKTVEGLSLRRVDRLFAGQTASP